MLERDALVMANARRLIKRKKATSNARLYMELFGAGQTAARVLCANTLGIDPDSNQTYFNEMMKHIRGQRRLARTIKEKKMSIYTYVVEHKGSPSITAGTEVNGGALKAIMFDDGLAKLEAIENFLDELRESTTDNQTKYSIDDFRN